MKMKLDDIHKGLDLTDLTPGLEAGEREVTAGFVSDLLSDVLAHAPEGSVLVTVQVHLNVIAVALHAGLAGVIFAGGRSPEPVVVRKAVEEGIPLYLSRDSSFEVVGRLYGLGLRGKVD